MDLIVLEEAEEAMLKQFGILLAIGLAVSAMLGYFIAGVSLSPITLLIDAAKQLQLDSGNGENLRLPVPSGVREVATLAGAVNQLIDEREASIAQLRNFTADAAHELRTPLTVLKGELEVELRITDPSNPTVDVLQSNLEEVERLIVIVEDLLLLAKLDQPEGELHVTAEIISIREALKRVIGRLGPLAASKEIELDGWFDEDIEIEGVAERFERMLFNIIHNAVTYTDRLGTVDIQLLTTGERKTIVVRDTGIGISAEALPHVFERFYRAERSRSRAIGGAGLGLAIVKSIAEQSECKIFISSVEGAGTVVTTELPSKNKRILIKF